MALSPEQRARLEAAAKDGAVDPAALIKAAEEVSQGSGEAQTGNGRDPNAPKLYMYLLPFVTVREVRNTFLGLQDPFPGDSQVASDWATAHPLVGAKATDVSGNDGNPA